MPVRIVTDSTSDIPPEVAQRLDVTVIAQNVHFGTETYKDNVTTTPDDSHVREPNEMTISIFTPKNPSVCTAPTVPKSIDCWLG